MHGSASGSDSEQPVGWKLSLYSRNRSSAAMGEIHRWGKFTLSNEGVQTGLEGFSQICRTCKAEVLVIRHSSGTGGITSAYVPPEDT